MTIRVDRVDVSHPELAFQQPNGLLGNVGLGQLLRQDWDLELLSLMQSIRPCPGGWLVRHAW